MGLPRFLFFNHSLSKSTLRSLNFSPKSTPLFTVLPFLNTQICNYGSPISSFDESLHSKITLFLASSPNSSVTPYLNQWSEEGKDIKESELQRIVRTLRSKKRFARALEVSEWMNSRRAHHSSVGDLAVQLDLIGKVHGIDAAENFFNELDKHPDKIYGALLNCYVRENCVDKALSLFNKMKDKRLAHNSLTYNGIMTLYMNMFEVEKVPEVLREMQENGVTPDNFSYKLCVRSYALRSDYTNMEEVLKEMESQPRNSIEWSIYTTVAWCYMQAGLNEKAVCYLHKAEDIVNKCGEGYNNLITMYAGLGDVSQVLRLWKKRKSTCRKILNIDYMTMIGSLVKLGVLEEAEKIFEEWESVAYMYDFRVPNVLLIGYTEHGQVEKAEKMLETIISKGKTPISNSWSIISTGHLSNENMERAFCCFKKALELAPQNEGWEPKSALVSSTLNWVAENKDIEEVEEFVKLLSEVVPMDSHMYRTLLKASIRHGRVIDGILERMKADNIDIDEETTELLFSR